MLAGPFLAIASTGVLLTTAVLFASTGTAPGSDGVAIALLVKLPLNEGSIVPLTVMTIVLPAPAGMSPFKAITFPVPLAPEVTVAVPVV
ncbi:hypothetical protein D3C85_985490 [compost metagenome]